MKTGFYYVYVLCTGAAVMALELAASRFLAPYFGTSMIVWANIIGLILLALSVGYFVGGRIADKHPNRNILMYISLAAGLWTAALPLWGHAIFRNLSAGIMNTPVTTIVLSLVAILLVFAPPVFLLAMVSPFTIRLSTQNSVDAGKVAGNLYAFSTIGSLVGTFGTAFGTIPYLGVVWTLLVWSALLVVVSIFGLTRRRRLGTSALLLLVVFTIVDTFVSHASSSAYGTVLWKQDTLYQYVQVVRQSDGGTALIYNEGGGVQSVQRPHDALAAGDYYDDYLLLPFLTANAAKIAVLGSAGGTIPHLLSVYDKPMFPQMRIIGVEIDSAVIPLDYRFFGVQPGDMTAVNEDARVYIRNTQQHFDIVIVDAYRNQIYIPPNMSTVEFFREIKARLTHGGLVALNVNAVQVDSPLLRAFEHTLHQVFPYVYRIKARGDFNYLIMGSQTPLSASRLQVIPDGTPLQSVARNWPAVLTPLTDAQVAGGMVLTDDRAPIEMMTDSMIFGYAGQRNSGGQ